MRISDWSSDVGSSDVAGVAGGVAHVVVDAGVDDDGGAVAVEQLIVDCQVGVEHFDGQLAGGRHVDVGHVAGVRAALGIEPVLGVGRVVRSDEHTSELQSLMRNSYAGFCMSKT